MAADRVSPVMEPRDGAPEGQSEADVVVSSAMRSTMTRWISGLAVGLVLTMSASVGVAVRAPDAAWSRAEERSVSYAALGGMQEVTFTSDQASVQAPRGRVVQSPAWQMPTPEPTPSFGEGPTPRPTGPAPVPSDEPEEDDEDDAEDDDDLGDELGAPDPLVVSASSDRAAAGQSDAIVYTFSVQNISTLPIEGVIAETHIPSGTYAAGSCSGFVDEGTTQAPVCADVPGLPATGSDDHHLLRFLGTLQPGQRVTWTLKVRVGSDTPDGATIIEHCRARAASIVVPSDDIIVSVT